MAREARAADVVNVAEMRRRARRRLPRAVFDAIDGAAGDEVTLRANRAALERLWLRPRSLADVRERDLRTTVLGRSISFPVILAPCAFARMANGEAELAAARAAASEGTIFALSGGSSCTLEEVKREVPDQSWYQMYSPATWEETEALIGRVRAAGYEVLCVTVDTALLPVRERDYRNRLSIPLQVSPTLIRHGLSRPLWAADFLFGRVGRQSSGVRTQMRDFAHAISRVRPVTLDQLARIKQAWGGPLVVKGILRGDRVAEMVDVGVDGIVVSNHGGRQLDGARPAIDCLPEVVEAAAGKAEVYVDGGFRRGSEVVKALALGARAVLVGRPYMFGLAAYGEAGVRRVLEILKLEFEVALGLSGCVSPADVGRDIVIADRIGGS
ncbi:MAG: alpha-hydroxy acid oxidase [Solirubrobacterales bacterium]